MHRFLLLSLFLSATPALALDAEDAALSQWVRTRWTAEQGGLPDNNVYDIHQDSRGYLWLATESGLLRFDGSRFVIYDARNTPGLRGSVRCLEPDGQGGLWVGTAEGLLHRAVNGELVRYTMADGLPHARIRAMSLASDGSLFVATVNGLARVADGKITRFSTAEGLLDVGAATVLADGKRVWIGTSKGVQWFEDGQLHRFGPEADAPVSGVDVIHKTSQGILVVAGEDGRVRWLKDGRFVAAEALPSGIISLTEDASGRLWVGTQEAGLARYRDGALLDSSGEDDLFQDMIRTLFRDSEGNVWIGTATHGLIRLRPPRLLTWAKEEGLSQDLVWAVTQTADGSIWLATGEGLAQLSGDKVQRTVTRLAGRELGTVWSLHAQGNVLWVGATGGLFRMEKGEATVVPLKDVLGTDVAQSMTTDPEGDLWVGSSSGLLGRLRHGVVENLTEKWKLPRGGIACLVPTPSGAIRVCSLGNGLLTVRGDGSHTRVSTEEGLASDNVYDVLEDERGVLWMATTGGLARVGSDGIVNLTVSDGLFDQSLHRVLPDDSGNLWMSTNRGVFRVERAALDRRAAGGEEQVVSTSFGAADGMKSPECNGSTQPAGMRDAQGRLWFPTIRGVVRVHPSRLQPLPPPAQAWLESAQADGQPISSQEGVAPGVGSLELEYSSPALGTPDRVGYQYRLQGYDRDWVSAGNRRVAYYTNLDPGEYTFTVRTVAPEGAGPPSAPFTFRMRPAFHQTGWFLVLCVLAVGGVVTAVWSARVRYLRKRQRELEAHNVQLAKALAAAEEAARVKSEFVANTSHELRTPLNAIVNVPEGILEMFHPTREVVCSSCQTRFELEEHETVLPEQCPECGAPGTLALAVDYRFTGDGRVVVKGLNLLKRSSRHLLSVVNDLLDFSRLEAGRESLHREPVQLEELFAELVETLQPWASERALQLKVEPLGPEWAVSADPLKLRQVLMNLISNAIKFSSDGSTVQLRARPDGEEAFVISVQDHGAGIAPEHHQLIFESFRQVDGSHTRKVRGTGLGLSITKKLVELHGGRIWVESALGQGATFHVRLDAARTAQENAA